jgi:dienelactone hydrolase
MNKRIALAVVAAMAFAGVASAQAPPPAAPGAPTASLAPPPQHPQKPGPYKVAILSEASLRTHTVYRPADLKPFTGKKRLPIIAWGNGACSNAGLLFQTFLSQVASHGYLAIASGPKDAPLPAFAQQKRENVAAWPDPNSGIKSAQTKDADLIAAIDWAIAENARKDSPYYDHLDPTRIAVMGQSCGGLQATWAAADSRVKTVVIWNSGTFPETAGAASPARSMSGANKASVTKFHAPVAYFLGGPTDVAYANGKDDFSRIPDGGVPAFLGSIHSGHGGTYDHPGGGWFAEVGVAWLGWRLKGEKGPSKYFVGKDCKLCKDKAWEVLRKNM